MARGRHVHRRTRVIAATAVVAGVVLLGAGGVAFAAYRYDQGNAHRILPGITIAGVDVGDMTRAEAARAVQDVASEMLASPLTLRAAGEPWVVTPRELGERADVQGAVDRAFSVSDSMSLVERVWHRVREEPVDVSIDLGFRAGRAAIASVVDGIAREVAVPARDAGVELVDDRVRFRHARVGRELRLEAAARRVAAALAADRSTIALPVKALQPKVTDEELGATIVVSTAENRLWFYEGFELHRAYDVATAAYGYSTPPGTWEIVNKVENPTWYNPAPDTWGADMPLVIPPGPDNPLGTRALYLNAPGIRIHGTSNVDSIGTHASHGCIRMYMSEVEELYPRVPIGTKVLVY